MEFQMEVRNIADSVTLIPSLAGEHSIFTRFSNFQPITHSQLKVKSYPLDQIKDRSDQESLVIRDLLHVLLGLEGVYIRYNNSYDPTQRMDGMMPYDIAGPDYKIAKNMDPSLKSVAKKISKVGRLYVILSEFINRFEVTRYGTVIHRLCSVIHGFLKDEYLPFIVEKLERGFNEDSLFGIRIMEQILNEEILFKTRLLYEMVMCVLREMERRDKIDLMEADFENFMQDLKTISEVGSLEDSSSNGILITDTSLSSISKGGVVLQMILEKMRQNWGNQRNLEFLRKVWIQVSQPYCEMLNAWLIKGELNDPYEEFLISNRSDNDVNLNSINSERLWDTQYVLRKDGLTEQFQNRQLQYKVLMTGKLLNLFKQSCGLSFLMPELDPCKHDIATTIPEGTQLLVYVDKWYQRANDMCWELLKDGYQLSQIMKQLHWHFMLYNDGGFQTRFFAKSMIELSWARSESTQAKLQRVWHQHQRQTTSGRSDLILQLMTLRLDFLSLADVITQFEDTEEILTADAPANTPLVPDTTSNKNSLLQARNFNSLKNILLRDLNVAPCSAGGSSDASHQGECKKSLRSIHYLCFDLVMPFPLNALISKPFIVEYQIIQRHLLLLRYYNRLLETTWVETTKAWLFSPNLEIRRTLLRCRILHNRLAQLVKTITEYATLDVIDPDWRILYGIITGTPVPFARLQLAIHDYLANIMAANLLTNTNLYLLLLQIFELIHRYCKFLSNFCPLVSGAVPGTISSLPDVNRYLPAVSTALRDHVNALIEGVRYHNQRGHSSLRAIFLIDRLATFA